MIERIETTYSADGQTVLSTLSLDTDTSEWVTTDDQGAETRSAAPASEVSSILGHIEDRERRQRLAAAIATAGQWAADARGTTVTAVNAVATLQVVVDRLGIFFDYFADELRESGREA